MISEYKYSILLRTRADIADPIKAGEKASYEENFPSEALILFISEKYRHNKYSKEFVISTLEA